MPLLDPARLPALLGPFAPYFNVDSIDEIDSTNDALSRQLGGGRGLPSGSVLVSDRQTAGKGRQGRAWASSPEASLTFSLYLHFDRTPMQMSGLSLAVGLAIYRGLHELGAQGIALKWPNDVIYSAAGGQWAKLAGVLIELMPSRQGVEAVIGIGLNRQAVEVPGVPQVASLEDCLQDLAKRDRHMVLAALLKALHDTLGQFADHGFAPLRLAWQAAHAWQGQSVQVEQVGQMQFAGVCLGVDDEGALRLETPNGVELVRVGDVSLRPALHGVVAA